LVEYAPAVDRVQLVSLLWSAKESTLKALQLGLRADTRHVIIELAQPNFIDGWVPLRARTLAGNLFQGWWCAENGVVRTVVADRCEDPPIRLQRKEDTSVAPACAAD
jgi:4'-phosphopantetheinyl transferase EntD